MTALAPRSPATTLPPSPRGRGAGGEGDALARAGGSLLSAELARVGAVVQRSTVGVGRRHGAGAGVVWSADGLIVTNHHVVGRAAKVEIEHEGERYPGEVIARHPSLDLALVKVDADDLPAIAVGDSDAVRPGQLAIAVGHPLGDRQAVTIGIVVAKRAEDALLLTDVTLLPGNSGGPMVDAEGRMIGVNTLIAGERSFSIPVSAVEAFVALVTGTAKAAYLGVAGTLVRLRRPEERAGVLLTRVDADSPAHAAGLTLGDVLVAVGGKPIVDGETLPTAMLRARPGQTLGFDLLRGGEPVSPTVVLGVRPTDQAGPSERDAERQPAGDHPVEQRTAQRPAELPSPDDHGKARRRIDAPSSGERA